MILQHTSQINLSHFTFDSVSNGHANKIVVQTSNAISDDYLAQNPDLIQELIQFSEINENQKVIIDHSLLNQSETEFEKCAILKCKLDYPTWIRLSPSTFLVQNNGIRKKLLHYYNISLYPNKTIVKKAPYYFTLIFEGLDKNCISFDLIEDTPDSIPFHFQCVVRNQTDVYEIIMD